MPTQAPLGPVSLPRSAATHCMTAMLMAAVITDLCDSASGSVLPPEPHCPKGYKAALTAIGVPLCLVSRTHFPPVPNPQHEQSLWKTASWLHKLDYLDMVQTFNGEGPRNNLKNAPIS